MARGKYLIQMPQAPGKITRDVQKKYAVLCRHRLIEMVKGHRREAEKSGVDHRLNRRAARQGFEDTHLPEKITRAQSRQFDLIRLTETSAHPYTACSHQEKPIACL